MAVDDVKGRRLKVVLVADCKLLSPLLTLLCLYSHSSQGFYNADFCFILCFFLLSNKMVSLFWIARMLVPSPMVTSQHHQFFVNLFHCLTYQSVQDLMRLVWIRNVIKYQPIVQPSVKIQLNLVYSFFQPKIAFYLVT